MEKRKKNGLLLLSKKVAAILGAALASTSFVNSAVVENSLTETVPPSNGNQISVSPMAKSKPMPVLKLNPNNPNASKFIASHASHRSHRSHQSHYSHYSSYYS